MEAVKLTGVTISREQFQDQYRIISSESGKKQKLIAVGSSGKNRYMNEKLASVSDTYSHSYLITLKAIEPRKVQAVLEAFGKHADAEGRLDVAYLNNLNYVHEIIVNKGQSEPELPAKREEVVAIFDYAKKDGVYIKDQNEQRILNCVSFQVPVATAAAAFNFSTLGIPSKEAAPARVSMVKTDETVNA